MSQPKVTVIVPVYNVEKYLSRCMKSLINQTLKDIEIILVDDGSPDSSKHMCDEYALQDCRIKVIHKENGGLGFARNSGLEIATGEFVAFVDSDDYVDLKMYETLYNQAKDLNLDTVFCGFNNVDNKQKIHPVSEVDSIKIFGSQKDILDFLLDMIGTEPNYAVDRKYQMSVWRAIYSKKVIDNHNLKFCSEREFISEDIIFHIDYLQKVQKIAIVPNSMYFYCSNINSTSLTKTFREDRFEKYVILYKEICSRLDVSEVNNRAIRLLIGYSRTLIFHLADYKITLNEKSKIIKSISDNVVWEAIHSAYDYKKLPFYQKFVYYILQKRLTYILIFISFVKKNRN
jgi:glycosyltransferase involved in cell wall biosynthesis